MVGAVSISGFPFCGFTSKALLPLLNCRDMPAFLLLNLASVGTFLSVGLKLPYYAWFGKQAPPEKVLPVPAGMYLGMALTALSCLVFGIFPGLLLNLLPYDVPFSVYTASHIWEVVSLITFSGVSFWILIRWIKPKRGHNTLILTGFIAGPLRFVYRIFVLFPSFIFTAISNGVSTFVNRIAKVAANPAGAFTWRWKFIGSKLKNEPAPPPEPPVFDAHRYRLPIGAMVSVLLLGFVIFALLEALL